MDYGARYYDARLSRFLSVDPLADQAPGWTPYHYTFNNPVRLIDPDGRWPITPAGFGLYASKFSRGVLDVTAAIGRGIGGTIEALGNFVQGPHIEAAAKRNGNFEAAAMINKQTQNAAATLAVDAALGYGVGKVFGAASSTLLKSKALPGLSQSETAIANGANRLLNHKSFQDGIEGMRKGVGGEIDINGIKVVFEPDAPMSGMTLFGENGFVVGSEALQSTKELTKTVLHETHRLSTTASKSGVNKGLIKNETMNASNFADRAYDALNNN